MSARRPLTSGQVAKMLETNYHSLFYLIRRGHIAAPQKLATGDFIWSAADIARAKRALKAIRMKSAKQLLARGKRILDYARKHLQ
jgi:hypothetical protein